MHILIPDILTFILACVQPIGYLFATFAYKQPVPLSLQHGHYTNTAAPNLQHNFNIRKYFNNAPKHQSTNETYYTQENTVITEHKRKLALSMKTHVTTTTN